MNFNEAIEMIMNGLEDIEKYDEALEVIRKSATEKDDTYEAKYRELRDKYIARFGELTKTENVYHERMDDNNAEKKEDVEIKMLDFDGSTE